MFGVLRTFLGTQSEKNVRALLPYVKKINKIATQLRKKSLEGLREETNELRAILNKGLAPLNQEIASIEAALNSDESVKKQSALLARLKKLQDQQMAKQEQLLWKMLPTTFAIVKETARRFATQDKLVIKANEQDRALATQHPYITLEGDEAHWASHWEVAGTTLKWEMVHYNVQLLGGVVLHQGKVAEMATGEGKTVVAILPAFLNALTGQGVHIITVNDYLARRDMEWMRPLFQFHGLSVACIEGLPIQDLQRRQAYQADITYGTNTSFGFDYLYDNTSTTLRQQVQRPFRCAIIDEIDSVCIDDAQTPLIIAGPVNIDNETIYRALNPRIAQLYNAQERLVKNLLQEAKEKFAANKKQEADLALFRAYRGLPTYWPLITFLSEKGIKKRLSQVENLYLQENGRRLPEADEPLFFTLNAKNRTITLTDKGISQLSGNDKNNNFFVLSDIGDEIASIEKDNSLTPAQKQKATEEKVAAFRKRSSYIHATKQLLKAYTLFRKNREYIIVDQKVKIVDEKTGRVLAGRRYSEGLHQALEAKENLTIEKGSQVHATITATNLFRMYRKISGMTGTAATEATEFKDIYKMEVVEIPSNKPKKRIDLNDRLYKTEREKMLAIKQLVDKIGKTQRPILLITPSVAVSEQLRKILKVPIHKILNAKNHRLEAKIIAQAGQLNSLVIATQIAGRGIDIKVSLEAQKRGGLFVIIVEKNETRRVDNQARGRTGRQGEPGTSVCFLSLEDSLVIHWQNSALGNYLDKTWEEGEVLSDPIITRIIEKIQKSKEYERFSSRKRTLEYDNVLDKQRKTIYQRRNNALNLNQRLILDTRYCFYSTVQTLLEKHKTQSITTLQERLSTSFPQHDSLFSTELLTSGRLRTRELYTALWNSYEAREAEIAQEIYQQLSQIQKEKQPKQAKYAIFPIRFEDDIIPITTSLGELEKTKGGAFTQAVRSAVALHAIDQLWIRHLQQMQELQDVVQNAVYEQKDPVLIYKIEAFKLFQKLLQEISKRISNFLCSYKLLKERALQTAELPTLQPLNLKADKETLEEFIQTHKEAIMDIDSAMKRNARITVRYEDGTVKKDVKFKKVAEDLTSGKCTIVKL